MASRGMNTIVCADINLEAARSTALECLIGKTSQTTVIKTHAIQFDVKDEASVQRLVDETKNLYGRIDHFVNTAGVSPELPVL